MPILPNIIDVVGDHQVHRHRTHTMRVTWCTAVFVGLTSKPSPLTGQLLARPVPAVVFGGPCYTINSERN